VKHVYLLPVLLPAAPPELVVRLAPVAWVDGVKHQLLLALIYRVLK
jgi:hypothetical protein